MAIILDGNATAKKVRAQVAIDCAALTAQGITPGLAVILVGDDPASHVYVRGKEKACAQCGFFSEKFLLPETTSQTELLALIAKLNRDPKINGILCQMPLPRHIDPDAVILAIDPLKDVDCFHPINVGHVMTGGMVFAPCTPAGVITLLEEYGVELSGKKCVVVGRSNIVGRPLSMLLLHKNATVTICHSRTKDLKSETLSADVLIAAVGKAHMITGDMIKDGAAVVDVGMNRLPNGKLCGDIDFDTAMPKASFITPVPGGVGPMTITTLMQNTLLAAKIQNNIK